MSTLSIKKPGTADERRKVVEFTYVQGGGLSKGDIVVLKLDRPVKFSEVRRAVCVPTSRYRFPSNLRMFAAGWGATSNDRRTDEPLEVELPLVSDSVCQAVHRRRGVSIGKEFCAGYSAGGKDTCSGDSGGPLSFRHTNGRWYLGGVTSWGTDLCGQPDAYGVYTRVRSYWQIIQAARCYSSALKRYARCK